MQLAPAISMDAYSIGVDIVFMPEQPKYIGLLHEYDFQIKQLLRNIRQFINAA